ncbi:AraC family transcriptional regulator N-terminal domain-containing protein [Caulobacter segnis]
MLDANLISEMMMECGLAAAAGRGRAAGRAWHVGGGDDAAAVRRRLPDGALDGRSRTDVPVMAPLIEREILYRLLTGPQGPAPGPDRSPRWPPAPVNRAIGWIKRKLRPAVQHRRRGRGGADERLGLPASTSRR